MKADPTSLILLWQTKPLEKDTFCSRLFCPAEPRDERDRIAKIEASAGESDELSANDSQSPCGRNVQTLQMLEMLPVEVQADNVQRYLPMQKKVQEKRKRGLGVWEMHCAGIWLASMPQCSSGPLCRYNPLRPVTHSGF